MAHSNPKDRPNIDFDSLLHQGTTTYDSAVGSWWLQRAMDQAHRKAYQHIVQFALQACQKHELAPQRIVDYACGAAPLLKEIQKVWNKTALVGLDGSQNLLSTAAKALKPKAKLHSSARKALKASHPGIHLAASTLPYFQMPKKTCDLAFFVFPNLVPDPSHLDQFNDNGYSHAKDNEIARMLARFREMDPEDETDVHDPDDYFDELMTARVFSRHLRSLLKKGGLCIRVDYTQAPRDQLSDLTQWRCLFMEGALQTPIKGQKSPAFFRLLNSEYRKSKVIEDVYHQTGNPDDKRGGYMINLFQAI